MAGMVDANVSNYLQVKIGTVEITDIESLTGFAQNANIIEFFNYNNKYSRKLVGSASVDPMEMVCTYLPESAAYKAMEKARAEETRSAITITLFENATKKTGNTLTFTGIVGSKSISTEFDTQRTVTYSVAVDGGITEGIVA
ncbi:hypothetical protein ACYHQE_004374 [Aeromonas salmonicida]